jgi:pimeloyl-ACP methyl ester carboxylesterase
MSDHRLLGRLRPGLGRRWTIALLAAAVLAASALWIGWSEGHPREERRLRVLVHEQLEQWFPGEMSAEDGWHGLHLRVPASGAPGTARPPVVVLVHGLDEPGTIWDELAPALGAAGFEVRELRYPNDQGIDRSVSFLAERWVELPADRPVVLVGHSMGGLLVRDFVSRVRHPVGAAPLVKGPPVSGAILVGTPNHGSEWARMRVWLELRDQFPTGQGRRFSLFAALRDGTGEAKVDLRPGSDFLERLNARPWPTQVPLMLIAGRLLGPTEDQAKGLADASAITGSEALGRQLRAWWSGMDEGLGDGVVTLESVTLPEAPPPLVVSASHRGMLLRRFMGDPEPPAISPIVRTLRDWSHASRNSFSP